MADFTTARTTRQMPAAGVAGLLGVFAAICTIFAGGATLVDWREAAAQARWPVVSAVVERAEIVASARSSKDGGGKVWSVRARVRYEADGEAVAATLTSPSVFSEAEAASLQDWASQHRRGSRVDVSYDPSRPNRAVFASADVPSIAGRIHSDLILFAGFAIAAAGLLMLAKFLRARASVAAPVADGAPGGNLAMAVLFGGIGALMTGLAIHNALTADPFNADNLMGVPIALMFVFAGILIGLPPRYAKWRSLLAKLLMTCFALTFDWVAFGPGERHFTGSFMGSGFIPSEFVGRAVFGAFAVVLDICAIAMWMGKGRMTFGGSANPACSTAGPADRPSPAPDRTSAA
jgi:hypothetical protein